MALLYRPAQRRALTFVELTITVLIVGVLATLIAIAAGRALNNARQPSNRLDVGDLQTALEMFKSRFGFYPPSRLLVCENFGGYFNGGSSAGGYVNALAQDSVFYLFKMFPRLDAAAWTSAGIDWNGNGTTSDPPVVLEGDQCLVFFLGGIPGPSAAGGASGAPSVLGFAADPRNPANAQSADRIGPFYQFDSSRLVLIPVASPTNPAANPLARSPWHYSYLDRYGSSDSLGHPTNPSPPYQVYGYFSSYKTANGYNRYFNAAYPFSDCPTLVAGVPPSVTAANWACLWPYAQGSGRYLMPDSYQLVSAGSDGLFGPGSVPTLGAGGQITGFSPTWTSPLAPTVYPLNSPGHDDQANFCAALLGVGDG
jgi:type II secretory pathway pseudopilin PulG